MNLIRVDRLSLLCSCADKMYSDLSLHYYPVMKLQHCHNRSKGIYTEATKAQLSLGILGSLKSVFGRFGPIYPLFLILEGEPTWQWLGKMKKGRK